MYGLIDPKFLLNSIYESAIDFAIVTMDKNRIVTSWNVGSECIFGYSAREVLGQLADIIFTPEDREDSVPKIECESALIKGRAADYRWHQRKDGSCFWADGVMTPIYDDAKQHIGFVKILRDVTDRKLAQDEIHRLAHFDALTGLVNRFTFDLRLKEMTAISERSGQLLILHVIDLDNFKEVNDTLGHVAGDNLLKEAAHRMRGVLREADIIARVGGDEFILLQPNMTSPQSGGVLANKIIEVLAMPFFIDGHEVHIGGTIGIAICPDDATDPEGLVRRADLALYRAKNDARGHFHYFTDSLDAAAQKRTVDLKELRKAVKKKDFWLVYQPKINCKTKKTIAIEALLRFSNPQLAAIPVENVINLAVESGLMPGISLWVIREATGQARKWKDAGFQELKLCINVCSRELMDPQTPEKIEAILQETGLNATDIEIEITERQIMDVGKKGFETLKQLKKHGMTLALDDFGTGYSALSYLKVLPVDTVKLDQAFLRGVPFEDESCTIARAIIQLIQALKMNIIAEGVELEEQAEFLCKENCTALQGFYITPALDAESMTQWLVENS